jgi:hypothetical protein
MSQNRSTSWREAKEQKKMARQIEGETWPPAEPWDKADLLFLSNAVARGMPFSEVAGFLGRTEEALLSKTRD